MYSTATRAVKLVVCAHTSSSRRLQEGVFEALADVMAIHVTIFIVIPKVLNISPPQIVF
jgi:hypothetical protein